MYLCKYYAHMHNFVSDFITINILKAYPQVMHLSKYNV